MSIIICQLLTLVIGGFLSFFSLYRVVKQPLDIRKMYLPLVFICICIWMALSIIILVAPYPTDKGLLGLIFK